MNGKKIRLESAPEPEYALFSISMPPTQTHL